MNRMLLSPFCRRGNFFLAFSYRSEVGLAVLGPSGQHLCGVSLPTALLESHGYSKSAVCKGKRRKTSPTPQFKSINSLELSLIYGPTLTSIHEHWKELTRVTLRGEECCGVGRASRASPPGSAIPGILQARKLEWVAISFSSA